MYISNKLILSIASCVKVEYIINRPKSQEAKLVMKIILKSLLVCFKNNIININIINEIIGEIGCTMEAIRLIKNKVIYKKIFNSLKLTSNISNNNGINKAVKDIKSDNPLADAKAVGKPQSAILTPKNKDFRLSDCLLI